MPRIRVLLLVLGLLGVFAGGTLYGRQITANEPAAFLPLALDTGRWWKPTPADRLQLQFTGLPIDQSASATVYDIDMFDSDAVLVAELQARGYRVVCYLNAGAWEDWRPDKDVFPPALLGNDYAGWPGEKWLDIRRIDLLAPIMQARLDQCKAKGFDGVEPDNINGYLNTTGFPLTADDQLAYNRWLAEQAHARGLAIGLKNDTEQATALVSSFDYVVTEGCLAEGWCADATVFVAQGRPVFAVEYTDTISESQFLTTSCPEAARLQIAAVLKHRELDSWYRFCP